MASTKTMQVLALTSDTVFENFASLTLIDSAATDGFQLAGSDGVYAQIPTGIVVNIGNYDLKPIAKAFVKATSGKSLAVTAILLQ
jgi:hypothetical protein